MLASYCSNLHPGESLAEIETEVVPSARRVRDILGWRELGLDLRLGSRAIADARRDPAALTRLRNALDRDRIQVTSFNAFPLAPFQVPGLKDGVYRPDWTETGRLRDTLDLLGFAARICEIRPITVGTAPGGYRPHGDDDRRLDAMAAGLGRWAAAAARLADEGGPRVLLGLEPEPDCCVEDAGDWEAFYADHLLGAGAEAAAAELEGDRRAGDAAIAAHLGVCHDACHASVVFADQAGSVARFAARGAGVVKAHFSAAVAAGPTADAAGALRSLDEPRFLHQTCRRDAAGRRRRIPDLDRLDELLVPDPGDSEWRSHFHVPVDGSAELAGDLATTVDDSRAGLAAALAAGCHAVSVETYTWSVLAHGGADPLAGTARELEVLAGLLA